MTYAEAIQFLYSLRWFGTKLGLENTLRLAALAGNPQDRLRFIHVAGTNGKGSTCAMLESIYRAAGLRLGLFTSPHLVSFGERMQVNRQPVGEAEVVRLVEELRPFLKEFPVDHHPTFFEVVTVMALRHFAEQQCELVIWETGMGGRLDATNIVTPLASVITNIHYDHQKWLGATLGSIAAEKAGIIKPGVPVVTATDAPEALHVIERTAEVRNAPLTVIASSATQAPPLDAIQLPLLGQHQRLNAALAIAAIGVLAGQIPVSDASIRTGLVQLEWPGRLQMVTRPSGQKVLLDGTHNVGGAEILAMALREFFPSTPPALVLGILSDKDWAGICGILAPLAARIATVPVSSERSASPQALAELCRQANPAIEISACATLSEALQQVASAPFVTVTGSLYLVGEAMELLGLSPAKTSCERGLNDWVAVPSPAGTVAPANP